MKKIILAMATVSLIIISTVSCEKKSGEPTPFEKVYARVSDPENEYFWEQFHSGNARNVTELIGRLEKQYQEDSTNVIAAAHLGFAHFWLLAEGIRQGVPVNDLPLAVTKAYHYFMKAYQLNPNDKRVLGFLADAEMSYAGVMQSGPLLQQGYARGLQSISDWPEFNKFTIGTTFSSDAPDTELFKTALEWQWTTLEDCYTSPIDRSNPNIQRFISRDMSGHNLGRDRACYNSWIAPHNIEGYFLHMGDMIVKTGDYQTAAKVYELAKASPDYDTWEFKPVLEKRIQNAQRNTQTFLDNSQQGIDNVIISVSGSLCMSCHKMSTADLSRFNQFNWKKFFKEKDIYSVNGLKN